jgi:hypothetical protein
LEGAGVADVRAMTRQAKKLGGRAGRLGWNGGRAVAPQVARSDSSGRLGWNGEDRQGARACSLPWSAVPVLS